MDRQRWQICILSHLHHARYLKMIGFQWLSSKLFGVVTLSFFLVSSSHRQMVLCLLWYLCLLCTTILIGFLFSILKIKILKSTGLLYFVSTWWVSKVEVLHTVLPQALLKYEKIESSLLLSFFHIGSCIGFTYWKPYPLSCLPSFNLKLKYSTFRFPMEIEFLCCILYIINYVQTHLFWAMTACFTNDSTTLHDGSLQLWWLQCFPFYKN